MTDIDIKDFNTLTGIKDDDYILCVQTSGINGKIKHQILYNIVKQNISPSIQNGEWYIGTTATGINATGKIPIIRKGERGIEWAYQGEDKYTLIASFEDLRVKWEELTEEQRQALKLNFSDLTEEDIAVLQKPATDAIAAYEEEERIHSEWYNTVKSSWGSWYDEVQSNYGIWFSTASNEWNALKQDAIKATDDAKSATTEANNATLNTNKATEDCIKATELAEEYNGHQPKIGKNGTWEIWDSANDIYVDSGIVALAKNPVIIDELWYVWNVETREYENTGIAVNSQYNLTKEKIENVFTGEIGTHTHTTDTRKIVDEAISEYDSVVDEKITAATPNLTKEGIEKVYNGNIDSHTHDTVWDISEYPTDTWDGIEESSSLSGTGSKEDPYLIQKCSDFVYMMRNAETLSIKKYNDYTSSPDFSNISIDDIVYFKITLHLDFNNTEISGIHSLATNGNDGFMTNSFGMLFEIDGNGTKIINYKSTNRGVFDNLLVSNIHDLNFKNCNIYINTEIQIPEVISICSFPFYYVISGAFGYNICEEVYIHFEGNVDVNGTGIQCMGGNMNLTNSVYEGAFPKLDEVFSFWRANMPQHIFASLIGDVIDNTIKEEGGIVQAYIFDMADASSNSTCFSSFDITENKAGFFKSFHNDAEFAKGGTYYIDTTKDLDANVISLIQHIGKTREEMQSMDFADILSERTEGSFRYVENNFPTAVKLTMTEKYRGYTEQSPDNDEPMIRKNRNWEILSKNILESKLTGNVSSHRHDIDYYESSFETDIWDGTLRETTPPDLEGNGTEEFPYLINTCNEYLRLMKYGGTSAKYRFSKDINTIDKFGPYFAFNANLDFNNADYDLGSIMDSDALLGAVFDGRGAKISNIHSSSKNGVIYGFLCLYHDLYFDNIVLDINCTTSDIGMCSLMNPYYYGIPINFAYNIVCNYTLNMTGNFNKQWVIEDFMMCGTYNSTTSIGNLSLKNTVSNKINEDVFWVTVPTINNQCTDTDGNIVNVQKLISIPTGGDDGFKHRCVILDYSENNNNEITDNMSVPETGKFNMRTIIIGRNSNDYPLDYYGCYQPVMMYEEDSSSFTYFLPEKGYNIKTKEEMSEADFLNTVVSRYNEKLYISDTNVLMPIERKKNISFRGYAMNTPIDGKIYAMKDSVWMDISESLQGGTSFLNGLSIVSTDDSYTFVLDPYGNRMMYVGLSSNTNINLTFDLQKFKDTDLCAEFTILLKTNLSLLASEPSATSYKIAVKGENYDQFYNVGSEFTITTESVNLMKLYVFGGTAMYKVIADKSIVF